VAVTTLLSLLLHHCCLCRCSLVAVTAAVTTAVAIVLSPLLLYHCSLVAVTTDVTTAVRDLIKSTVLVAQVAKHESQFMQQN
jgi:hypothetical protein